MKPNKPAPHVADLVVESRGVFALVKPQTRQGKSWIEEACDAAPFQWATGSLLILDHYAALLATFAKSAGLRVRSR